MTFRARILRGLALGPAVAWALLAATDLIQRAFGAGKSTGDLLLRTKAHPSLAHGVFYAAAIVLPWLAIAPPPERSKRLTLLAPVGLAFAIAASDAGSFWGAIADGSLVTRFPVPLSAAIAAWLAFFGLLTLARRSLAPRPNGVEVGAGAATVLAAVVLHVHAFGLTDYRRKADAIVVLGARANPDGTASEALSDRVRTAVELYRAGYAPTLVMSGGTDARGGDEPRTMRRLAEEAGVPADAIVLDEAGVNTEATIANVKALSDAQHYSRVLAVSHYHHLPRIKLLAGRAGLACYTVPADEGATLLRGTAWYVLRESLGLVFYALGGRHLR